MKFTKSQKVNVVMYVLSLVSVVLAFYGLPVLLAQATVNKPIVDNSYLTNYAHSSYGLPEGYRFMYIIPATDAVSIRSAKPGENIYVAYEDNVMQKYQTRQTRTIHFLQPGSTSGTWNEIFRIQER